MKYETATIILAFFGLAAAVATPKPKYVSSIPVTMLHSREVPQEHSHNPFLASVRVNLELNNPAGIVDPVFGLLGNSAAAAGAGTITNLDCLHQATADQAFTNAKAAGNVTGQADALIYAALERNTGSIGLASVNCTETAVNPEIEAIQPHQDAASPNAAAINKAVVLELAKQLASIGANPQGALLSGTFAPGQAGDPSAAGNTCDEEDDAAGCIFTQNLLVEDATADEISAAVAEISPSTATSSSLNSSATEDSCPVPTVTVPNSVPATTSAGTGAAAATTTTPTTTTGNNVQTFTGTLGGPAPPVTSSAIDRPFSVNDNTFVNLAGALQRSCSIQHNACADAANSGTLAGGVGQCDTQETSCNSADSSQQKRGVLNFGSCTNPGIEFTTGLPGRTTAAFVPSNLADFNHGSALQIGIIASFICGQLDSACKAGADAVAACAAGQQAAAAVTEKDAADAFNAALGVTY